MAKTFQAIRSNIRLTNIRDLGVTLIIAKGEGYQMRASTSLKQFHNMPDSPFNLLVSVKALRAGLTFPLDPFIKSYLHSSSLTPIQLMSNSCVYLVRFTKYARLSSRPNHL